MKQLIKPYSLLMHLLMLVTFFFIGVSYAGFIEAGKGQMLAGGAIILGYGVIAAFIGFVLSLFISYKISRPIIIKINMALVILIVAFWAYFYFNYKERQEAKQNEKQKTEQHQPKTQTQVLNVKDKSPEELCIDYSLIS